MMIQMEQQIYSKQKKNRTEILAGSIWFGEFEFEKKVERL